MRLQKTGNYSNESVHQACDTQGRKEKHINSICLNLLQSGQGSIQNRNWPGLQIGNHLTLNSEQHTQNLRNLRNF